jgi:hypothetical protein
VRVRLGLLREYLQAHLDEIASMTRDALRSAPTDKDAQVPGHLPNELPKSASLEDDGYQDMDEEALVPGHWAPNGLEAEPYDHERLGDPIGQPSGAEGDLDETDDRMVGDKRGNGIPDPNDEDNDLKISPHLTGDEEKTSLGDPSEEEPNNSRFSEDIEAPWLDREIKQFMLQEYPAGAGMVDPLEPPQGFYSDFDMSKDHHDGADIQGMWYASPARAKGTDGDPRREEDPQAQLKMHPNADDTTTVHPSLVGRDGVAARRAPPIPQLSGGSDTSKTLGASAYSKGDGVGSGDGSQAGDEEVGGGGFGDDTDENQDEEQG